MGGAEAPLSVVRAVARMQLGSACRLYESRNVWDNRAQAALPRVCAALEVACAVQRSGPL
jgi:hypothetical protein